MDEGKQMDTTATNVLFAGRLGRRKCRIILSQIARIGSTYGADSNKIIALGMKHSFCVKNCLSQYVEKSVKKL